MQANKTVIINGRPYDAVTGLPVKNANGEAPAAEPTPAKAVTKPAAPKPVAKPAAKPAPTPGTRAALKPAPKAEAKPAAKPAGKRAPATTVHETGPQRARTLYHRAGKKQNVGQDVRPQTASKDVHAVQQRSQTLRRSSTKKPGPAKRPQPGKLMDIARSASISRFASHPVTKPAEKPAPAPKADKPHTTHPVAARAAQKAAPKKSISMPATARQVKDAAIAQALAPTPKPAAPKKEKVPKAEKVKKATKKKAGFKWTRKSTIITALFAVLITAAVITYINLPVLSVAFASAQAGINATYPKYTPDGYSLSQPVTFSENQVGLTFKSNAGTGEYTIAQSESSWDSSAVLENVVRKAVGDNYIATQERGVMIYTFDSNAAWISGGILYTIDSSEAALSNDQIRRIATSL